MPIEIYSMGSQWELHLSFQLDSHSIDELLGVATIELRKPTLFKGTTFRLLNFQSKYIYK